MLFKLVKVIIYQLIKLKKINKYILNFKYISRIMKIKKY